MDFLPKELEDIIIDYKYQIEHNERLQRCLKILKVIVIFKQMIKDNERILEDMLDTSNIIFSIITI